MQRWEGTCGALFAAALLLIARTAAAASSPPPWEGPAFSWDGPRAFDALAHLPSPADTASAPEIDVLLIDVTDMFDAEGRQTRTQHLIYRAASARAAASLATVSAGWRPHFEERPVIRARVLSPDGAEHQLDPATLSEGGVETRDDQVFTDVRELRAPLPAMGAGVLVEEEVVIREARPVFDAGVTVRQVFPGGHGAPRHLRLHVEAPESVPLKAATLGGLVARRRTLGGRTIIDVDAGPPAARDAGPPDQPGRPPTLMLSTGRSWNEVASAYSALVEQQIQAGPLPAAALAWRGDATGRDAIVRQLLARLHASARYTGLELGERQLTPTPPAETLARGYGDCKDLSTVLVAALQAAGIPAQVAMLQTRPDWYVSPLLPGLGTFNHAIVYIPGPPTLWVDPTQADVPAGELPLSDQGHAALIAAPDTQGLEATPVADAHTNRESVTEEIFFAEQGNGRIVERQEAFGAFGAAARKQAREGDPKEARRRLEASVRSAWHASRLRVLDVSPPDAVDRPYAVAYEADDAAIAVTTDEAASAWVDPAHVLRDLPPILLVDGDSRGTGRSEQENLPAQHGDLALAMQLEADYHLRLVPPAGYVAQLPPDGPLPNLGPFLFTWKTQVDPDGEVRIDFHLSTRVWRLTAADVDAVRSGIRALRERAYVARFESKAGRLAHDGRIREAAAAYQALIAAHPMGAVPHERLSRMWLAAGAGRAARAEAREAVRLEPSSARAHANLARVLLTDLLGREFHTGLDRTSALTAAREAVRLAPQDVECSQVLLAALSTNDDGVLYGPGAGLEEMAEISALRPVLNNLENDRAYLWTLLLLGRYDQVVNLQPAADKTDGAVAATTLAARTMLSGVPAALVEAERLRPDPTAKSTLLSDTVRDLAAARQYPDAAALFQAWSELGPVRDPSMEMLGRLLKGARREPPVTSSDASPVEAVRLFLRRLFTPGQPEAALSLLTPDLLEVVRKDVVVHDLGQERSLLGGPSTLRLDELLLPNLELTADGTDDFGYRVVVRSLGSASSPGFTFYVVRTEAGYRIAAHNLALDWLGFRVTRLLSAGRVEAARQWLDWALESPMAAKNQAFEAAWSRTGARAEPDLRRAAALLLRSGKLRTLSVTLLEPLAPAVVDTAPARKIALALVTAEVQEKRYQKALDLLDRVTPSDAADDQKDLFTQRFLALRGLQRHAEARALAAVRLQDKPHDAAALQALAGDAYELGNWDEAERLHREQAEHSLDTDEAANAWNQSAWASVPRGRASPDAVRAAEKADTLMNHRSYPQLNTLAAVYAEADRLFDAYKTFVASQALPGQPMWPYDWLVVGRLYEKYGLTDDALTAYAHAAGDGDLSWAGDCGAIAVKRMAALKERATE